VLNKDANMENASGSCERFGLPQNDGSHLQPDGSYSFEYTSPVKTWPVINDPTE